MREEYIHVRMHAYNDEKMRNELQVHAPVYKIVHDDFLMKGLSLFGTPSTSGSLSDMQ